jgi:predicted transcriptional regulator
MKEIVYKQHPLYKHLTCGTDGSIFSSLSRRVLNGTVDKDGYIIITISENKKERAHRIILECFNGFSQLDVDHLNMIKDDNRLCNLEYVSCVENLKRSRSKNKNRSNSYSIGENNPRSVLSEEAVLKIKSMREGGSSVKTLSKLFNVSCSSVYKILNGSNWSYL